MRLTSTFKPLLGAVLAAGLLAGCGSNSKSSNPAQIAAPNMGVNSYLWRASLETLNFMPLEQVDPFGGVIVTDWYANSQVPNERFKANVYILDTNLRADALKATIFKQNRTANGWEDANVDADTARQIENAILTRARQLYIATEDSQ